MTNRMSENGDVEPDFKFLNEFIFKKFSEIPNLGELIDRDIKTLSDLVNYKAEYHFKVGLNPKARVKSKYIEKFKGVLSPKKVQTKLEALKEYVGKYLDDLVIHLGNYHYEQAYIQRRYYKHRKHRAIYFDLLKKHSKRRTSREINETFLKRYPQVNRSTLRTWRREWNKKRSL